MPQFPFLNLKKLHQAIASELSSAIEEVVKSNAFVNGPQVREFEREWAAYCGANAAVGCANGTAALHAVIEALGISRGDEVILPSHTFVATAESVRLAGATPVFAEIDEGTMLLDPASATSLVSPRTKAIVAVHLYGMPCPIEQFESIAALANIPLVEDAAQAQGARYRGSRAGTLGTAAAFSFFPGKNLGAFGDAGAITCMDDKLGECLRMYVDHGRSSKYENTIMGTNYRLDTIQAAVLLVKLRHLDEWNANRAAVAARYRECLKEEPFASIPVVLQNIPPGCESSNHIFPIRVSNRDAVMDELKKRGVACGIHYPIPCHLQPSMADVSSGRGSLPVTECVVDSLISLPICPTMVPSDAEAICDILALVLKR